MSATKWIANTDSKKPMPFCTASALPTVPGGQAFAEIAENCGESDAAAMLQNSNNANATDAGNSVRNGDAAHIAPDAANASVATRSLPMRRLHQPPNTQPNAPMPMTANVAR